MEELKGTPSRIRGWLFSRTMAGRSSPVARTKKCSRAGGSGALWVGSMWKDQDDTVRFSGLGVSRMTTPPGISTRSISLRRSVRMPCSMCSTTWNAVMSPKEPSSQPRI